jgi:dihydrofolate synthase/folylpolyglutamate synthase
LDPLSYLYGLEQFGIKFGLENISTLVAALGHPERAFRSVHIAGTNGKGSVTAMVDAALRAAGHRSARYTSPHLVDLTERFVIDGRPIGQDTMVAAIADVRDAVDALRARGALVVQPTFFEVTTAVAFELFRRAGVDLAVIEVGLGGRLDATNVLTPLVTAITSIAFDHQRYLGSTLRDIALEKGGIIKPGVPVVIGELADEADAALATVASDRDAELIRAKPGDVDGMAVGLLGAHQRANAAVAVRVLQTVDALGISVPSSAIAAGLAHPHWPGRLEWRRLPDGRELLLDAAHNPAGAAALASYLTGLTDLNGPSAKPPLLFAVMRDKDVAGMLSVLSPVIGSLVVTRASTPRSADPVELSAIARRVAPMMNITVEPSPDRALAAAWRDAPWIVVAGSIFLLGDVMKLIDPP